MVRLLRTATASRPPFSSPRLIRPEPHVDEFLRRADRVRPAAPAPSASGGRALASHVFMREYALLQRAFLELDDRLGESFAPASVLMADLPGSQAAALLAAHDKWGGAGGTLTRLASPQLDALATFRELCPERDVTLAHEGAGEAAPAPRRYDLICATYDASHSSPPGAPARAGLGGGGAAAPLAEAVLAMSALLNPGGVLVVVEPLGAEHLGELYLEPTLVPAVRHAAADAIARGARLRVVAPCMHSLACPLLLQPRAFHAKATRHCTFAQRYERRRTQRLGGMRPDLGYGSSHFAYLCLSASGAEPAAANAPPLVSGRILTPPRKRSGHVMLDLCTSAAELRTLTVSKGKHGHGGSAVGAEARGGERGEGDGDGASLSPYRAARVSSWGDPWVGPG